MLLLRPAASVLRTPSDRSKAWYARLFRYAPKKTRYTPEQAADIIAANWELHYHDLKDGAVY